MAQRIAHTDPSKARASKAVNDGAGQVNIQSLLETGSLDTNLFFLHAGAIPPKSGIGNHFHNECEEMFVIFDGAAQFTIDGRTSLIRGPAGAPCRMGHSHAIYNPTDRPVQWMNIKNPTAIQQRKVLPYHREFEAGCDRYSSGRCITHGQASEIPVPGELQRVAMAAPGPQRTRPGCRRYRSLPTQEPGLTTPTGCWDWATSKGGPRRDHQSRV